MKGTDGYAKVVSRFFEASESINFAEIHRCILHLLPKSGGRVLDIGAGTGRDAAALAEMGWDVVAVEPLGEFLNEAKLRHTSPRIEWVSDCLPHLGQIVHESNQFNFVLCHAVWQHIGRSERQVGIERIANLMKDGGVFALGIRHGPQGAGTHYFPAGIAETVELAATVNFETVLCLENQPSAVPNKSHVTWTRLAFVKH